MLEDRATPISLAFKSGGNLIQLQRKLRETGLDACVDAREDTEYTPYCVVTAHAPVTEAHVRAALQEVAKRLGFVNTPDIAPTALLDLRPADHEPIIAHGSIFDVYTPTADDVRKIPAELKAIARWVTWRPVRGDDGKLKKVPTNRGGTPGADAGDPDCWGSFDEIYKAAWGSAQGIGFRFDSTIDNVMGVDLDHCLDKHGKPNAEAQRIIDDLNSYTEITPGGDGLHIIAHATMPNDSRIGAGVEMYAAGRFFTFTGRDFAGTPDAVQGRQEQVTKLYHAIASTANGESEAFQLPDVLIDGEYNNVLSAFARSMRWYGFNKAEIIAAGLALNHNTARVEAFDGDTKYVTDLMARNAKKDPHEELPGSIVSDREGELLKIGELLKSRWSLAECEILEILTVSNEERCSTPLAPDAVKSIAAKAAKYKRRASQGASGKGADQVTKLLDLCRDFECFHANAMADNYVRLRNGEHYEIHKVMSVERVVTLRYLEQTQRAPSREALTSTMATLTARCAAGPSKQVHVRFARSPEAIYIDLCDETWRAIEITATGWRIVDDPPVYFRRAAGALPLPIPVQGGSLSKLREVINLEPDQFVLAAGWLLGVLNPNPRAALAHLVIQGGHGSAKTSAARILISTLDPSDVPLTGVPKSDDDALLAAQNCGILGFDNLSGCRAELSDTLCRFSTGGGRRVRTLYETSGVTVEAVRVPVLMNGIDAGFMRADLADRSIVMGLPTITQRRTDAEIDAAFTAMHPGVLGAVCDLAATGLRNLPNTVVIDAPRMADFCTWMVACAWEPDKFLGLYRAYQSETNLTLLENDQVGAALVEWANAHMPDGWGTEVTLLTGQWLQALNTVVSERAVRVDPNHWPKSEEQLGRYFARIAPLLKEKNLTLGRGPRTRAGQPWLLQRGKGGGRLKLSEKMLDVYKSVQGTSACEPVVVYTLQ